MAKGNAHRVWSSPAIFIVPLQCQYWKYPYLAPSQLAPRVQRILWVLHVGKGVALLATTMEANSPVQVPKLLTLQSAWEVSSVRKGCQLDEYSVQSEP